MARERGVAWWWWWSEEEMPQRESVGRNRGGHLDKSRQRVPQGSQIDAERATLLGAFDTSTDGISQILIAHHASYFRIICSCLLQLAAARYRRFLLARARNALSRRFRHSAFQISTVKTNR
jgi:hypothetical protein